MYRPTWVEINLDALRHNVLTIRKLIGPHIKIMGIVKADAYGHGDYEVSRVLLDAGVEMLGIAILEEGLRLRTKGITAPLILLGGLFEEEIKDAIHYGITPTVYDMKSAELIAKRALDFQKKVKIHIYVDTGMGSIGVQHNKSVAFVAKVMDMKSLLTEGIYTHFSSSDEKDRSYTSLQMKRFFAVLAELGAKKLTIPLKHVANSGAILGYPESSFTMVRPGLSLYGLYPSEEVERSIKLKPVMSFKSRVMHVKNMEPGDLVGYGRSYRIHKPTRVATLPLGYDDGYNRLLSNQGEVLVRGRRASIIGKICMDQCFVDVTHIQDILIGDEVVLYGTQEQETISIETVAKQLCTIPYEITCNIGKRVPRIYIDQNE
ncbi:MAG: alanine racemase [Candidatus Brocadiaceae bacterium]|nr:alanine racemase [Candidatus Brocadiaceae bacterium]